MELNNESKTLFMPLLGKALMSKSNLFLHDRKAEEIINHINYDFNSLKQSKWLSMYMSVRALIIDELCNNYINKHPNSTIIHLGCGLDSRCLRLDQKYDKWYDIDFENVIELRKQFYRQDIKYKMIGCSVVDYKWLNEIESTDNILIVAEGLLMYLSEQEVKNLIHQIENKFENTYFIFDSYSKKGVKVSKVKNPVNQMNAKVKFGMDNPRDLLKLNEKLVYIDTHIIKREDNNLPSLTKFIFNNIYCGRLSQSIYKIYEFKIKNQS